MNRFSLTLMAFLLLAVSAFAQTARVQLIHNSPNPSVDIYVNGFLTFNDFTFRTATPFLDLPAGLPLSIAVAPANSLSVLDAIATFNTTFNGGQTYVVTASGIVGDPTTPFTLITDDAAREGAIDGASNVNISVLHGAPDAPAVDVVVRTGGKIVSNAAYGQFTPYLSVPAGDYYLDVKPAGTQTIVGTYRADLSAAGGQAIKVMASGLLNGTPGFGLYAVFADGSVAELPLAPVARVQVLHNSPSPTVDVYANTDLLLDNFEYRTATPFIFVPAGVDITLGVAPATSTSSADAIATFPVNLENGKTYIVTASGIVGDPTTPFGLIINNAGQEVSTDTGKVDIAVLHGSTNAPAVDVDAIFLANNVISNLAYGEFTGYLGLTPDKFDLAVRAAGDPNVVASFRADLSGLKGGAAYVFASGLLGGSPAFGLFAALPNGTVIELPLTPTARLQVVHNSPEPTVDVYAGNTLLLDNFAFRTATPYINVPSDRNITLGVAGENSSSAADAIATFDVNLTTGGTFAVTASGIVGNPTTPFTLIADGNAREAAINPSDVDFNVLHGAPNAPAVDIAVVGLGTVISNLAYSEFTPYLSVPPASYQVQVIPAGTSDVLATYTADLSGLAGGAARIFASGLLGGTPAFGLFAALADGTVIELPLVPPPPVARVQVIHNSPSPTVDVYANADLLIDNFEYRTATQFIDVPAGVNITLGIAPENSNAASDAIATFDVNLEEGKTYIVTASGIVGDPTTPFTLLVNDGAQETSAVAGNVDVAVLHGSTNAPAVDVDAVFLANNVVSNLSYGEFTGYIGLAPDKYDLAVRAAGDPNVVASFRADLSGLAGGAAYVFASGLLGGSPAFGLFAALPNGTVIELPLTPTARLQVVHNSPEPTVDVYAGNTLLLDNFAFRTATPYINVPSDRNITLGVAGENSSSAADAIATFDVNLTTGGTFAVTASGIVGNPTTPFTLIADGNAREAAINPSDVDFNVLHGAPNAPAVDIAVVGLGTVISNLAYSEFTPYLSVPPASYQVQVIPAGTSDVLATYTADLSGLAGGAARIFASGLLGGTPAFGLFAALADGTVIELPLVPPPPVARVQVIHNSPSPTVDVYANADLLIDNFEYRTATQFIDVPAGVNITLGIAPENSNAASDAIATFDVNLEEGKTYIVTASGIVGDPTTPFTLLVNDGAQETSAVAGNVDVAVLHGSTNAPAVDVDAVFLANNVVSNLSYGEFTGYIGLAPDKYDLAVRAAGDPNVVASFRADLSGLAGGAAYVFASGLLGGSPAFGLFAALPNGAVIELPLTPTARVQVVHNSPDPTVDVYAGNSLFLDNFEFRTATPFVDLPADRNISVGVALGNSNSVNDVLVSFPVNFTAGESYTVFANGVVGNPVTPFGLVVDNNARETAGGGTTSVSVFHGSPDAPAVDIAERLAGELFADVSFGEYTPYLDLPSGEYFIDIRVAGQDPIVSTYAVDLTGLAGQAIRVFASGFLGGTPGFGLFAVLPDGTVVELPFSPVSRVQIIHNSPSPTVDIYANGDLFLDNFEFRSALPFIYVPAQFEINFGVAGANSQSAADTLANFPVTFENGKTYVVVASGLVGNATTPFALIVNDLGREQAVDANVMDIAILHGAPDAPAVDIRDYFTGSTVLAGAEYGDFTNYLSLTPEPLYLEISPNSAPTQTVGIWGGDFSALGGLAFVVYASGLLSDGSFDLYATLADGTTFPLPSYAQVQVIHNSPELGVDVYYSDDLNTNGVQVLDNFQFRQATGIALFPAANPFDLVVAPQNSSSINDGIYTLPVSALSTGKSYTIMASGVVGGNPGFELAVNDNARFRALNTNNTEFSAFHGSPDAPEVDVTLFNGPVLIDNLQFGEFSPYLSVPASDYVISVTPANDNNTVVQSYQAPLTGLEGQSFTVFASGYLTGSPSFGLWVALTNGSTFPLPVYVSTNELDGKLASMKLTPNPATDEVWVRLNLTETEALRYAVRDVSGRLILEGDFGQVSEGEFAQRVEVGQLAAGMYQLEVRSDNGVRTQKFAVQR